MLPINFDMHHHKVIPFPLPFLPESRVTPSPWLPVFIFFAKAHMHRLLINPMRDGSGKAMKQGAILKIIF
jgi:hypothetical protein